MKRYLLKSKRFLKYYLLKFFRSGQCPEMAAGGFACGVVVNFYPTFGIGLVLALLMAKITKTSLLTTTLGYGLTMPFFPFFFYSNYVVGRSLTGLYAVHPGTSAPLADLEFLTISTLNSLETAGNVVSQTFSFSQAGTAFVIGSLFTGLLAFLLIWQGGSYLLRRRRQEAIKAIRTI